MLGSFDFFKDKKDIYYVCAIGNAKVRKEIVDKKCSNFKIKAATLIHPSVIMSSEFNNIEEGCIICAGNIITVNSKISRHTIINLDCTIGHDVVIGSFSTIYPSVNISGNCTIGECCEVGTGSQIIQGINIANNTIIGAGSVVIKDIEKNCVAVGAPAKVIKTNL